MSNPSPSERRARRVFLRAAATAGGLAGLGALSPTAAVYASLPTPVIGTHRAPRAVPVLLPPADGVRPAGTELLSGLRRAGATGEAPIRFQPHHYTTPADALRQLETLTQSGPPLVIAALSRTEASVLGPLLDARGVTLLVCDAGASMIRTKQVHPAIFRSTLGHWQAAWATGQYAATIGERALIISGFYESGFDTVYAFWSGFERAGGTTPQLLVTGTPNGHTIADAVQAAAVQQPSVVFAAYSGARATEFVRAYAAGLGTRVPLLGSPFLTDPALLPEQGVAALGIRSAHPWTGAADANRQATSAFAALGYDTGRLVQTALGALPAQPAPTQLRTALAAATVTGLRGAVRFTAGTQETTPAIVLQTVSADGTAHVQLADLTALAINPLTPPDGPPSGWRNAYLLA